MNEGKRVSEEIVFWKRKNERLFSYIFVYQKNLPSIVLVQLDAKAKLLATLNKQLVKRITLKKKKKGVVRWDLESPIGSWSFRFSASYSMLSQSLVTPTSLARLFINPEFCQCPLRCSCQLQLF